MIYGKCSMPVMSVENVPALIVNFKLARRINLFQPCVTFYIETGRLICTAIDWSLYGIQQWTEFDWSGVLVLTHSFPSENLFSRGRERVYCERMG